MTRYLHRKAVWFATLPVIYPLAIAQMAAQGFADFLGRLERPVRRLAMWSHPEAARLPARVSPASIRVLTEEERAERKAARTYGGDAP